MIRNISVGIDIGTTTTRVVVSEFSKNEKTPKIIATGQTETKGLRHGYIVNFDEAVKSIKNAVAQAENISGIKIRRAFVSIGGVTLSSEISHGSAIISKADNEVTTLDVKKAIKESEDNLNIGNKKIIHTFPISYKLDEKEVLGHPEGLRGIKLEVKTLFITCLSQHLEDLLGAVADAGVEPIEAIASPIASAEVALTDKQKMVGCAIVNIGSETVSIATFENGLPISLHIFSIGSSDITNDIALGLKIPLEEAEKLKIGPLFGSHSKKKLDEIIEARLSDIFELIENHLKKIKRNGLLPAGIIFTGGGSASSAPMLEKLSKGVLGLPSRVGGSEIFANTKTKVRDSAWFVALGLCMSGQNSSNNEPHSSLQGFVKDIKGNIKSMFKQLLP
ncbi:MAG: cell division protein FtsA [Candidatus Nomurabacteria bacterium]|nr:cell division protein FtsA [Candidatus Nomurabacteria bacterium]